MDLFERLVAQEGQEFLGWRRVKTDASSWVKALGSRAGDVARFRRQKRQPGRRRAVRAQALCHPQRFEKEIEDSGLDDHKYFYFSSLSCRTLVYKRECSRPNSLAGISPTISATRYVRALCACSIRA